MSLLRCRQVAVRVSIPRQASCTPRLAPHQYRVLFTNATSKTCLSSPLSATNPATNSRVTLVSEELLSTMATVTQIRAHSGHSHGHAHDNSYLVSSNKNDAGVRVTRLGLGVNVAMAASKMTGGYYFNSQALFADGVHALTDLLSDFLTLFTVSYALRPPDQNFPNGYGRLEGIGSVFVSGSLLLGGLYLGLGSLGPLYTQFLPDLAHHFPALMHLFSGHGHGMLGHSHSHEIPNLMAAWLAAGSIVVKEWLYRRTMKIAKERRSSVLASSAVHHRVDSLTSIVALVAIGGAHILSNAAWLDPVGSLIVSGMITKAGGQNLYSACMELMDRSLDDTLKQSIRSAANVALADKSLEGPTSKVSNGKNVEVREVHGTKAGQNYLVEVVIAVPGSFSTFQTRNIEHVVRQRVGSEVRGVRKVRVKFVPQEEHLEASFMDDFVTSKLDDVHDHDHASHGHSDEIMENGSTKARKRQ